MHQFLLLLSLLSLSLHPISSNSELTALMHIKSALDPTNKLLNSWSDSGDPCADDFAGVACNNDRKVANISLQGKGLAGKLSPAIGELKSLTGLYLHYNSLTGEVPKEIGNLTQLSDLYLNFNNFSGSIPPEIGNLGSLQVLDLCCNQLAGNIPTEIGSLKRLSTLSLEYNQLSGTIPASLATLGSLKRVDLSFNRLSGAIPIAFASIPPLETLDVRNNTLSGIIPPGLKRLNGGFSYGNNSGLCGRGIPSLRPCTSLDNSNLNINTPKSIPGLIMNQTSHNTPKPAANLPADCTQTSRTTPSRATHILVVVAAVSAATALAATAGLAAAKYRRQKQKIGSCALEGSSQSCRMSVDQVNDLQSKSASPLVSLAYSTSTAPWDPLADGINSGEFSFQVLQSFRFNLEEIESATQYFSEQNVLGRGNFSTVYKGVLRDGSVVAIKCINVSSCKAEEAEFVKGMNLLTSLKHENLVNLRGFCCSRGRGECFLVYDFASNGNLSKYLDVGDGNSTWVLDWDTRVSIVNGIAKGLHYLHEENEAKPTVIHQNISTDKILIDHRFNPLITNSGIRKILADDVIFSTLKVSAAMGYLPPEYITTGKFTEKSDVYAFGVIVLQILSGKHQLTSTMRSVAESGTELEGLIDPCLEDRVTVHEAQMLAGLGALCMNEDPDQRPSMGEVAQELNKGGSGC